MENINPKHIEPKHIDPEKAELAVRSIYALFNDWYDDKITIVDSIDEVDWERKIYLIDSIMGVIGDRVYAACGIDFPIAKYKKRERENKCH